jgi:aryl-alcohol dehydrogenase-like predicted oxidoreductase
MELRKLGQQGPEISVVGYGAWEAGGDMWGPNESDEIVVDAMRAALDSGMNWIDTAEVYGRGRSERLVAQAIAGQRDEVLIFTKVAPRPSGSGFRADQVKAAIRGSLDRLGTDHVDLYQLHWPDGSVPVEETWTAMAELQDEGLGRHIGVSNFDRVLVERCLGIRHVDSVQNEFSLFRQDDRKRLLPWMQEQGVGYLAYGPLAFGLLTGAVREDTTFPEGDWRGGGGSGGNYGRLFAPRVRARNVATVDGLQPIAERLRIPVATLALRWVVQQRGVAAAIAGSRSPQHVRENAGTGEVRLDDATLGEVEAIFA